MIKKRENSSIKEIHLFRRINKFINWIIFVQSIFLRDFKGWTIEQGNDCLSWVTRRHTIINGRSDEKLMNAVSPVTPFVYTPRITSLSKTLMGRNSLRAKNPSNENLEEDPIWCDVRNSFKSRVIRFRQIYRARDAINVKQISKGFDRLESIWKVSSEISSRWIFKFVKLKLEEEIFLLLLFFSLSTSLFYFTFIVSSRFLFYLC